MRCLKIIRCLLFPLREKAEETSTKAIRELEETIAEIREIRIDSLNAHYRPLAEQDADHGLNATH